MPLSNTVLSQDVVRLAVLVFADFGDLPLRGALGAPQPIVVPAGFAGADGDAAGQTFECLNENLLAITALEQSDGGAGSVTITLLADPDNPELIEAIDDPALYDGRPIKFWECTYDEAGTVTGIELLDTLYMTTPRHRGDGQTFVIEMDCESYLALVASQPFGETYLTQGLFDSGDQSAAVTLGMGGQSGALPQYSPVGGEWLMP